MSSIELNLKSENSCFWINCLFSSLRVSLNIIENFFISNQRKRELKSFINTLAYNNNHRIVEFYAMKHNINHMNFMHVYGKQEIKKSIKRDYMMTYRLLSPSES